MLGVCAWAYLWKTCGKPQSQAITVLLRRRGAAALSLISGAICIHITLFMLGSPLVLPLNLLSERSERVLTSLRAQRVLILFTRFTLSYYHPLFLFFPPTFAFGQGFGEASGKSNPYLGCIRTLLKTH
jgi:hypothetical protein